MKNHWKIRHYFRSASEFHLDFVELLGDTFKEKYEAVYVLLYNIWTHRGTDKIIGTPESLWIFDNGGHMDTEQESIVRINDLCFMNCYMDSSKQTPEYSLYRNDMLSCKVFLKNFMI
jgi:hypothetical protein